METDTLIGILMIAALAAGIIIPEIYKKIKNMLLTHKQKVNNKSIYY